ncbi:hypothetical protein C8J56DRAFT_1041763 [Mycena floridula]|nr:hypothetical protein C8J56DRAFT_1041763 [Mycena floridula]
MPKAAKESQSQKSYEVEVIVSARVNADGDWEYLVKWSGYNDKDNTWEPEESVKPLGRLFSAFWKQLGAQGSTLKPTAAWIAKEKAFYKTTFGDKGPTKAKAKPAAKPYSKPKVTTKKRASTGRASTRRMSTGK